MQSYNWILTRGFPLFIFLYDIPDYSWHNDTSFNDSHSYNEHWSEEYDYETDYEDYFDLREHLKAKICERNEEPEMNKVCCTEDDIQVGFFAFLMMYIFLMFSTLYWAQ